MLLTYIYLSLNCSLLKKPNISLQLFTSWFFRSFELKPSLNVTNTIFFFLQLSIFSCNIFFHVAILDL